MCYYCLQYPVYSAVLRSSIEIPISNCPLHTKYVSFVSKYYHLLLHWQIVEWCCYTRFVFTSRAAISMRCLVPHSNTHASFLPLELNRTNRAVKTPLGTPFNRFGVSRFIELAWRALCFVCIWTFGQPVFLTIYIHIGPRLPESCTLNTVEVVSTWG